MSDHGVPPATQGSRPGLPDTALRAQRQRVHIVLGLILAVGFLLRLTYLLEAIRAPDFDAPQFESQYHDYWARALVSGDWTVPEGVTDPEIHSRPYFRPPGYPWFLAGVYRVFGPGYLWPRVVQMLLGLLSAWLAFVFARRWHSSAAGLGAAALASTYWLFIFFEAELMAPALLIVLLLLALVTAARWREAFNLQRALLAGLLLGAAALVRPNVLALPPVFLLWIAWVTRRGGGKLGAAGFRRPALAFMAAAAVAVLPATVRNLWVAGDPVLVTSNAGINLFVGSHPEGDGFTPGVPELGELTGLSGWDSFDYPLIAAAVERHTGRELSDSEVSRFFVRRAVANALDRPAAVLALGARKLALFWGPQEVSNNKVLAYERLASPTLRSCPGFATVLALAIAGGLLLAHDLRTAKRREGRLGGEAGRRFEVAVLLLLFVVVYSSTFLPFFVAARFRLPVVPALILFAGVALGWLWQAARERRWRALAIAVLAVAVLRTLTGIAWVPYEPDLALWHWRKGLLYQARGDAERAIAEFRATVAADAEHGEAHLALADALADAGRAVEAAAAYRAALAAAPGSPVVHNNLALLLIRRGETAAAVEHWQAALALEPDRISVLNNLAYALATDPEVRDPERAVELAQRACELTGYSDPQLLRTLQVATRAAQERAEIPRLEP